MAERRLTDPQRRVLALLELNGTDIDRIAEVCFDGPTAGALAANTARALVARDLIERTTPPRWGTRAYCLTPKGRRTLQDLQPTNQGTHP